MKTGIIKLSSILQGSYRIDPSLHLSEGVSIRAQLQKSPYELSTVEACSSRIFLGNIFSRCFVKSKEFGVTYLSASDTVLSDIETGRYISKRQAKELSYLMLEKDWILVTCSGTLGNITYTNNNFADKIATHDLIRIVPSDAKYKKGCLYVFLSSKYGYYQMTQSQFGGVVKHINDIQLGSIIVPKFPETFQQEVDDLIQDSARLREEAINALKEAVFILESEIGDSKVNLGYNYKTVKSRSLYSKFYRFDSQYQIGKSQITKYAKSIKIGNIASQIFVGNRGKRYYVNKGVPFLSSSDMMLANPLRFCKYISNKTPSLSEMLVHDRDILISRSGTVGNTIIVGNNLSGVAVSEHAMRLVIKPNNIPPEYVFTYFKTKLGHDTLKVLPYGSVIVTLGEDFLADIDLPIIDEVKMNAITELVSTYIDKQDKSIENENRAISMVEQEIEKWNN